MARATPILLCSVMLACSSSTNNIQRKADSGSGGASGASGAAGSGGASSGGSGGSQDSGTDAPAACASTKAVSFEVVADTAIFPEGTVAKPNCEATITAGTHDLMSVGAVSSDNASRILLRFQLGDAAAAAVSQGKVKGGTLTVYRETLDNCPGKCPAEAGPISVYPLTSKWVEGGGSSKGATWCWADRENKSLAWGENGANKAGVDHGDQCGQAQVDASSAAVSFDLDPKPLMAWVDTQNTLSLILISGGAKLFVYTREHSVGKPATLTLEVCD